MIALICCGELASLAKLAVAIGNCVEPTPVTSTFNWACAAVPAAIRQDATGVLRPSFVIKLMLFRFRKKRFQVSGECRTDPRLHDSFPRGSDPHAGPITDW